MPLPSFASLDDLEAQTGPQDSPTQAEAILARVSTAIRAITAQTWVDTEGDLVDMDEAVADILRSVTVDASERRLRNPDGATTRSTTLGPYTESTATDAGNIYFTKVEREQLDWAAGEAFPAAGFSGLGTIPTTRGPIETAPLLTDRYYDDDDLSAVPW